MGGELDLGLMVMFVWEGSGGESGTKGILLG